MSMVETPIDEQSPDEDERIAQQFLRSNRGRNNVIRSGEQQS